MWCTFYRHVTQYHFIRAINSSDISLLVFPITINEGSSILFTVSMKKNNNHGTDFKH